MLVYIYLILYISSLINRQGTDQNNALNPLNEIVMPVITDKPKTIYVRDISPELAEVFSEIKSNLNITSNDGVVKKLIEIFPSQEKEIEQSKITIRKQSIKIHELESILNNFQNSLNDLLTYNKL